MLSDDETLEMLGSLALVLVIAGAMLLFANDMCWIQLPSIAAVSDTKGSPTLIEAE
jgi:hypothetical protein